MMRRPLVPENLRRSLLAVPLLLLSLGDNSLGPDQDHRP